MNQTIEFSLATDFYELTMMQGYFFKSPEERGIFEMFFRKQPFNGGYTVFAGMQPFLDVIEGLSFSDKDINYLDSLKIFSREFLDFLAGFKFRGDIYSMKEGALVFPGEPLVRVHGTMMETQLIESILLNFINFQSLIATKTARIVDKSGRSPVLEFGLRRAQGIDGSISATRAAYIGGASSTSNTLAGKLFNIPVSGTMAHSWVMSFSTEIESFEKYVELYPDNAVLLVDTFDTLRSGIPNAITVFNKIRHTKPALMGVRIDSGDLEYLSKKSRQMFDEAGLEEVKIFVSSDIDEWIIKQLNDSNAPIDAWGVGTRLVTGGNDPALTGVYKIVAKENGSRLEPCIKISNQSEKITNPGSKNVLRFYDKDGQMLADLIYLESEHDELMARVTGKEPIRFNHPSTNYAMFTMDQYDSALTLLQPVMKNGKITCERPGLPEIRQNREREIASIDETCRRLLNPHIYRISLSDSLKDLKTNLIKDIKGNFL